MILFSWDMNLSHSNYHSLKLSMSRDHVTHSRKKHLSSLKIHRTRSHSTAEGPHGVSTAPPAHTTAPTVCGVRECECGVRRRAASAHTQRHLARGEGAEGAAEELRERRVDAVGVRHTRHTAPPAPRSRRLVTRSMLSTSTRHWRADAETEDTYLYESGNDNKSRRGKKKKKKEGGNESTSNSGVISCRRNSQNSLLLIEGSANAALMALLMGQMSSCLFSSVPVWKGGKGKSKKKRETTSEKFIEYRDASSEHEPLQKQG